jgi:hypothetical protein
MEQLSKVEFWKMLEQVYVLNKLYKEDYPPIQMTSKNRIWSEMEREVYVLGRWS